MIDVISFGDGIRDAEGVYRDPLTRVTVTEQSLFHFRQAGARIISYAEFIERLSIPKGGWPFPTARNFARRLGLPLDGIEKDERAIKDALLVHYGELEPPTPAPKEEEVEVVDEEPTDLEKLAVALEADNYNAVKSLVSRLHDGSTPSSKVDLYEIARGLL